MAFPIPNVPTDNLYKFVAIAGLVLCLFSSTLIFAATEKYEAQLYEAAVQDLHVEDVLEDFKANIKLGKTMEQLEEDFDYYQNQYKILLDRKALVLHKTPSQKITFLRLGFYFGGILSLLGFVLWYFNVQRFHDEILRTKAKKQLSSLEDNH